MKQFIRRMLCQHYFVCHCDPTEHEWDWMTKQWRCRKCGKIIRRPFDWFPINQTLGT
jgi:hypothetical protein